ncbi:MAG: DUF3782 domain-containing protein [Cytophagales bacterium]|nr:DUF3782 domain-containing protein [Cytophagales bacterium]
MDIGKTHFPDKKETESKFDRILKEIQQDRIEQSKKWEKQNKKWDEQDKKWEKQNKKWDGQDKKWEKQNKKWDGQNKKWEKQDKKWEKNHAEIRKLGVSIDKTLLRLETMDKRHVSSIGALGARWGLNTEATFRNAIKGILEPHFNFEVTNIQDYDEEGGVFGHPEQIELDIAIFNKTTYLIEIKSSMSRADMYIFNKKASFYIKKHKTKNTKLIVISPMIDDKAKKMAKKLNITAYSHYSDVEL